MLYSKKSLDSHKFSLLLSMSFLFINFLFTFNLVKTTLTGFDICSADLVATGLVTFKIY